jgi:electron transport complex protein RnfD
MSGEKYFITPGPHIFCRQSTQGTMRDVICGLAPAVMAGIYFFRTRALLVLAVSVVSCVLFEAAFEFLLRKRITLRDRSAVVTGLLFAMVVPPSLPLWACVVGCFVAIGLAKQIFGGLGSNIFNPALLGRAFLMAAFPTYMTRWSEPFTLEAVTGATPLGLAKFGHDFSAGLQNLFIGTVPGSLGETSALALLAGGAYLLVRKTIDWRIPSGYIGTVLVISFIAHITAPGTCGGPLFQLLAGGLLIGAFFMATDPVTSPVTKKGRWVFGIGCGIITMLIRFWGGLPEGVMYAILLMNALTPLLNRATRPRRYGT